MARPAERRVPVTIRVATTGRRWLEDLTVETEADLSTVARAAFALARRHEAEHKALIKEMRS
jgi:hypothetical protein